jgi:YegS/Rv2252/BmrU family lipid kinase
MASVPGALEAVRLGVVPLGTINVFARELGLPQQLDGAWQVIERGREQRVDLPRVEFAGSADRRPRHFVQLAGCGLDARAIAAVNLRWKRRIGPLAYALAVLEAMRGVQPRVRVETGGQSLEGELVVVGNGRLYGGEVTTFPQADLQDGVLDARVFPRVTLLTFLRFGLSWLGRRPLSRSVAAEVRGERFELTSTVTVPVQADGDNVGALPACFTVQRQALRVLVPSAGCPA